MESQWRMQMNAIRILVVEDEGVVAMDLEEKLQHFGYLVVGLSATGEDAVEKTANLQPDLVLMDIVLKGPMNGIEASGRIRERFGIPVVYVTAHADDDTLGRAKTSEPFGYLVKPVDDLDLRSSVEMALYKSAIDKERAELIARLQQSLASLKTLEGLLPICAWCKKVRNDRGFWIEIENYFSHHTGVKFSHGICDECLERQRSGPDHPESV